jgi:superfamily II DNA or RNA helicase
VRGHRLCLDTRVTETAGDQWRAGLRISVRGQLWTIVELTAFKDCNALRLSGAEAANRATTRTILLPFDRPGRLRPSSSIEVMRPRRWLRALYRAALNQKPFGGLSAAAASTIDFLPYQLEPALAMLRHGYTRMLIADAVGLGKTIQAGLILGELATEHESFRALVIAPAGLREQWAGELAARFGISTTIATSFWLARTVAELPSDVNPWSLPGIYISSFDFIKRPEVLRPFEEDGIDWDALVVDEAHAATLGTARRAAVHAVALRARRVILLSATPHSGDPEQFRALCGIGNPSSDPRPLLIFRRTREDSGTATRRRTVLFPVRLSEAELRMHRVLEAYTSRVYAESRTRGDLQARLAAIVLRKRALSSASSLAVSCRRRLALLRDGPEASTEQQLPLPLGDEEPLEDEEPVSILAAPGLADAARERHWLATIVEAAEGAVHDESKLRFVARLLGRIQEPAIVFTEYRDTLERMRQALSGTGRNITVLHGGMNAPERSAAQHGFNSTGSLLIATDAASEGLNLHHRCRIVIHFELPWSPARLEQRTGRVDRIGQNRVVHEIMLVANATAERLVLAPLARRAVRAHTALPGRSGLFDVLTESRVAAAVMDVMPLEPAATNVEVDSVSPPVELQEDARAEAPRLVELRTWRGRASRHGVPTGIAAAVLRAKGTSLPDGIICVYTLSLTGDDGNVPHAELVALHEPWHIPTALRTREEVRDVINAFRATRLATVEEMLMAHAADRVKGITDRCAAASAAMARREAIIAPPSSSVAQHLVQGSLFDQRLLRASVARMRVSSALLEDAERRLETLLSASRLTPALSLSAILLVTSRRRA